MHGEEISYAYGLWSLVIVNVALFAFFILSYLAPVKKREWRSMGVTIAFFVALFTEMYGFPLTIYILTAILGSRYPALNPFSHASGHLWLTFLGGGATMMTAIHIISNGLVIIGFAIMWKGWKLIHGAKGGLVREGPYAYVSHPQYSGLFLIMIGMLIQWPTIITALMFPVLVFVYYSLSKREEAEMLKQFGDEYKQYMERTPMFVPKIGRCIMPTDPVCRMTVSEEKAVEKTEYKGKTYYFCGKGCKERFEKDPEKYLWGKKEDWVKG